MGRRGEYNIEERQPRGVIQWAVSSIITYGTVLHTTLRYNIEYCTYVKNLKPSILRVFGSTVISSMICFQKERL